MLTNLSPEIMVEKAGVRIIENKFGSCWGEREGGKELESHAVGVRQDT